MTSFKPLNCYIACLISGMCALAFVFIVSTMSQDLISNEIGQSVGGFVSGVLSVMLYQTMYYRLTK